MITRQFNVISVFVLLVLLVFPMSAVSQTAEEIITKMDRLDDGDTAISESVMILIDNKQQQRVRQLKSFRKDYGEDSKSIMFFITPADVRNTAFLTYDWDDESRDDDSWLYLPALRKPKRIASNDKSGSFMGSDFTYSDVNGVQIEDWDYKFAKKKEEKVDGFDTWVIEGRPKKSKKDDVIKRTGYLKTKTWIRKDIFMTVKAQLWVKQGKKIKYLKVKDISKVNGIWTAHEVQMTTTKRRRIEHSSILRTTKITYNVDLQDDVFTIARMERGL
jgi:hypothetical protein